MSKHYAKAEIYLTECIHPDYNHLRYLGLDTKCDPNYLGSSVTLKWWINYLGRSSFKKTILKSIKGTMGELCKVEQKYIMEHDAVRSPNYFNMNGGTRNVSVEEMLIDMHYIVRPVEVVAKKFVNDCIIKMRPSMGFFSHNKRQLASRVLCMMLYGFFKYDQTVFEYSHYTYYNGCNPDDFQGILAALSNTEIADSGTGSIKMTEQFIEELPIGLTYELFEVQTIH